MERLLCAWAFLWLAGSAASQPPGLDFAVVFMQNVLPKTSKAHLELLLTSFFPDTMVNIRLPRRYFSKAVSLTTGIPKSVALPEKFELLSSARSNMTVRITSNKPISVVAINMRPHSTGVTVVSPISGWGSEYYIITPEASLEGSLGQVAIVNGPKHNFISVLLMGLVQLENTTYLPGEWLNVTLGPWESVQLQTNQSLTASHLVSQEDVALFAGLGCTGIHSLCRHVYLQMSATTHWGSNFVLPPVPSPGKITILTSRDTLVRLIHGNDTTDVMVTPGMMQVMEIDPTTSLLISSVEQIMVLLNLGENKGSSSASGILLNLPPIEKSCVSYAMITLPGFNNSVLLVATEDSSPGLELNHKPLLGLQWKSINMTQLVYTDLPLGDKQGYNFISDAGHDFGLVTLGLGSSSSFALPGICLDKEHLLCGFECTDSTCRTSGNSSSCVLLEPPTCMAWGQTHLRTFYSSPMRRSLLGPHILIYSQGDDLSLQPFKVERDARSDLVVRIWVFDLVLEISPTQPGVVLVNNKTLYTPVSLSDGDLNITRFGFLASIVNVSFGLRAIIGDHGFLHIQVAGRYYDGLSGDCVAQSSKEMLNSTVPSLFDAPEACEPILVEDLNVCDGTSSPIEFSHCKIILESETFQSCHVTLNPDAFIQSCESEVCNGGSSCPAIESYALACGINGIYLTGWRNISHCDLHCPSHSHYDGCPTKCPASCSETDLFPCDPSLCYEACVCEEGYELSAGSCVPKPQCGCYWQSSYYPEVDFIGRHCQTRCLCSGPYVECQQIEGCDAGSTCETNGTTWYCQPSHNMSCMLYSDSRFIAFDGKAYSFNGLCGATMAGVCSNYSGLEAFEVNIVHDLVLETLYIEAVNITVYGRTITFSPEHSGQVYVDGILVYTPYVVGTKLQIYTGNIGAVILQTEFGLVVSFDQMKRLLIKVPDSYFGSVCGLCASGMDEASNKSSCVQYCGDGCYKCSNETDLMEATTSCGLIKDPRGPFRECYGRVDPSTYYDTCVDKLCSGSSLCPTFSAYAATCQEAGGTIDPWRRETSCGYECPPFSTHTDCASNCPLTCGGSLPLTCEQVCHEGCQCEPGYLLSGDGCVPPQHCGCNVDGQYWKSGDIFYEDQCQKRCTCLDDQIICENHNCPSEELCAVVTGVQACYPRSSTCLVSGQTCLTFDGLSHPANNCLMAMAESTNDLVGFQVQLRRKGMNNGDLASVHKAVLIVYGYSIALSLNSEDLEINGNLTNLPVNLDNHIFGYGNGSHLVLQTVFGLQLTINSSMVSLTIPLAYAGRVWGLCGNDNARSGDDTADLPVRLPSDKTLSADYTLCNETQEDVPYRTPATQYCALLMEVKGPFKECHVLLDPKGFYNGCMLAVNGDNMHLVCQHIQNYSNECQLAGARSQPWKNESLCQSMGPPIEFFNLTTSSPSTAPLTLVPVKDKCLPGVVPAACLSLHETSCLFQTPGSFPWPDQSSPAECSLSLAEVCRNDRALDYFSVSVHYKLLGNQSTESVHVEVYGLNLVVPRSWENGVLVNQMPASLPACIIPGKLQIRLEGHDLILDAFNGLVLKYNHKGFLLIQLPFGYQGYICGQCALKETSETRIKFTGEVSNHSANQCLITVTKEPWTSDEGYTTSPSYCDMLLSGDGPFSDCHRILSPDPFYDECKFHVCQELERGGNGVAAACRHLEDYVTLCQFQNVSIKPWRNESFCPFTCFPNGTYELCTRTCRPCPGGSCQEPCPGGSCQEPCLEGCRCTEGFLWDGINCVTSEMCSKGIFPVTPKHLSCGAQSTSQGKCPFCQLNYSQILTLGNILSPLEGNGAYDVLKKCDSAAPQWLRVVLRLQPPQPAKLHVFYDRSFLTINSTLAVWVNGRLQTLPITLAPELQVSKGADVVVLGQPGNMAVTFSSAGDLKIEVADTLSMELCGACTYGNFFPNPRDMFSLETWRAEDLSWFS